MVDDYEEAVIINDLGKEFPGIKPLKIKPGLPIITVVTTVEVCLPTDQKPIKRNALHQFRRGLTRGDGKICYNYLKTSYKDLT